MSHPIRELSKDLPLSPGVYLFLNAKQEIIYIGKAIKLKNRVQSYANTTTLNAAKRAMVEEVNSLKVYPCDSEIEALILEAQLIKKYDPRYNVLLKDDKSYAYLAWTKEEFPRLFVTYQSYLDKHAQDLHYLGPFINSDSLRQTLRILRKIFPYRSCKTLPKTPCLYYKLGLCDAPCTKLITKSQYQEQMNHIIRFMKGQKGQVLKMLQDKMVRLSESQQFERAAEVRDQINALNNVALHKGVIKTTAAKKSGHMKDLKERLGMDKLPKRIEGYDSSHFHGDKAVVSMVVFENGLAKKADYRRFKIKDAPDGGDDFYNLSQALTRRFQRTDWPIPDLILIDGGRGQLTQAIEAQKAGLTQYRSIPIVSLAKQLEEIYFPYSAEPLLLPRSSKALQLLQSVRDESHRFAVTYHRKLREEMPMKELRKKFKKASAKKE